MTDQEYMRRAISLAKKACGWTNPNPMVGAVIVKDGRIIGEGYHRKCGELHAERNAFASLTESAEGATIYVSLEPCCHYGKTPPCTEAIIENGIARVVIGSRDPNPLVSGKGAKMLREKGIEVIEDFLRDECDQINPVFFHYITSKKPYVVVKYAQTLDGKIATSTGDSQWITNEKSREAVHKMRHKYMAIMAGIGTVLADDPMLNVRIDGLKSPIRVICDSRLRIPLDSQIVRTADKYQTYIATAFDNESAKEEAISEKISRLEAANVKILNCGAKDSKVDLDILMTRLGQVGIDSILVEGGGGLNDSIREAGLANQIEVFIGPKIFGGKDAKTPVEGKGLKLVSQSESYRLLSTETFDDDIHLTYISHRS